jgi:hypothetical protein
MAVSQGRRSRSWRNGNLAARRYQWANPDAKQSTWHEDVHMHIDFWHDDRGVDVKGNNLPNEIWVEFKNVRGDLGWLFGEAEWIAFDMPEVCGFVVVDRVDLKQWCYENVNFDMLVPKDKAYKRCYRRKDREDLITKVALSDLQELESYRVVPYCTSYSHPNGGVCYVTDSTIS